MDQHLTLTEKRRLERVKAALEKYRMNAYVVDTAAEVAPLVKQLLPAGCTAANGGSMTLKECGVMDLLRGGDYTFLDREAPGADPAEVYHQAFSADWYLASANAITENGEIYEMDGRGNRVAALVYGPQKVLLVAGRNKIVEDLDAARRRNRRIASPANCVRLGLKTPCAATGECPDCQSPQRICCAELVLHQQSVEGRITVILVNEELGY